jgi:predicted SAM-dependent methyltransferase
MVKVQYGANDNLLDGWINFRSERDGDITKPLALFDNSVDFVFTEHVQEHITHEEAYRFLKEVYRILKPGGVYRVIVPDVKKIQENANDHYLSLITESAPKWWPAAGMQWHGGQATVEDAVQTIVSCHGHKALYTADLLLSMCEAVGFRAREVDYGKSIYPELDGIDSHWKYIGLERVILESACVEAVK